LLRVDESMVLSATCLEGGHFRVKGDTASQLLTAGAVVYGLTRTFVLVRLAR
jgi:hypothetical protein